MKALRAMRALARVELRQVLSHPQRSLFVLLLVAIPVAAIVGGSTLARITGKTAEESCVQELGSADVRVDGVGPYEDLQRVYLRLPPSAITKRVFVGRDEARVPGRRLRARLFAMDEGALEPPGLAAGYLRMQAGRAPRNSGEVALSPVLLSGLDRTIGETVTLEFGPVRTITGIVVDPESLETPIILRTPAHVEYRGQHQLLVRLPEGNAKALVRSLREADFAVTTRVEVSHGDPFAVSMVFALGCIGFFEAALVIASAFAVSLRRRQFEIGLLGATGATVGGVTVAILLSAAAVAAGGGFVGSIVGLVAAALVHPSLDHWNDRLNGPFEVSAVYVALAIGLGIAVAVAAAAAPVRHAARVPVRVALGGRRPASSRSSSWLRWGLALVAIGSVMVLFGAGGGSLLGGLATIVGPIFCVLGFGASSPWILDGLAHRAAALPLTWRLAVRDAGRFRFRNGPVVTAVLAGMAMSVTMAILVASLNEAIDKIPAAYRSDQLMIHGPDAEQVARALEQQLPCVAVAPLAAVYSHGMPVRARFGADEPTSPRSQWIACGGDALLRALGAESGAGAFRAGRLLALRPPNEPDSDGASLQLTSWVGNRQLALPTVADVPVSQPVLEPLFVINRARLPAMDLEPGPPLNASLTPWLVRLQVPLTKTALEQARAVAAKTVSTSVDAAMLHHPPVRQAYWLVLVICVLTGIVVILVATALSAAESAGDRRILHSIGAAPTLIRSHLAARAGYLAALGCLLAVPAGIFPALGLFKMSNLPLDLVLPWRDLLLSVLVLPLVVYAITWWLGSTRRPRWNESCK